MLLTLTVVFAPAIPSLGGIIFSAAEQLAQLFNGLFQRGAFGHALLQKGVDGVYFGDGVVDFRVRALGVGADIDQVFRLFVGRQDASGLARKFKMTRRDDVPHDPAGRAQNIDGREVISGGNGPGQDDMAIEDGAYRVGNRFGQIITVHQNRVKPGDGTLAAEAAGAFQKFRQGGEDGRGCSLWWWGVLPRQGRSRAWPWQSG